MGAENVLISLGGEGAVLVTKDNNVVDNGIEEQLSEESVYADLLRGELTQEVIELRDSNYRGYKGSFDYQYIGNGNVQKKNETIYYLWRVMGIENGKVRMRAVANLKKKTEWDNRFNTSEGNYWGYNDFDLSILSEFLKSLETPGEFLDENELAKIEPQNLCIGNRALTDDIK